MEYDIQIINFAGEVSSLICKENPRLFYSGGRMIASMSDNAHLC
jgi:hypothetical protein